MYLTAHIDVYAYGWMVWRLLQLAPAITKARDVAYSRLKCSAPELLAPYHVYEMTGITDSVTLQTWIEDVLKTGTYTIDAWVWGSHIRQHPRRRTGGLIEHGEDVDRTNARTIVGWTTGGKVPSPHSRTWKVAYLLARCWHPIPSKRATASEIVTLTRGLWDGPATILEEVCTAPFTLPGGAEDTWVTYAEDWSRAVHGVLPTFQTWTSNRTLLASDEAKVWLGNHRCRLAVYAGDILVRHYTEKERSDPVVHVVVLVLALKLVGRLDLLETITLTQLCDAANVSEVAVRVEERALVQRSQLVIPLQPWTTQHVEEPLKKKLKAYYDSCRDQRPRTPDTPRIPTGLSIQIPPRLPARPRSNLKRRRESSVVVPPTPDQT